MPESAVFHVPLVQRKKTGFCLKPLFALSTLLFCTNFDTFGVKIRNFIPATWFRYFPAADPGIFEPPCKIFDSVLLYGSTKTGVMRFRIR